MSSSSSSASASASDSGPEQHHLSLSPPPPKQLLFTDCKKCDTYLAVYVPRTSTSSGDNSIRVRCGHCANILTVNNVIPTSLPSPNRLHFPPLSRFPLHAPLLEWYRRNSPPNTPPEEMDQLSTPPPPQTSD